jgi:proteasome lid subunit RPN8/RPN11
MIVLADGVLTALRMHAEKAYPEECCGILLGTLQDDTRRVIEARALENTSTEPRRRRYWIGPEEYRAAESAANSRGWQLLGFYRSHPDHPAHPSAYDLAHALPWHSYVILGVESGRAGEWTAWVLAADRSRFEPDAQREEARWRIEC